MRKRRTKTITACVAAVLMLTATFTSTAQASEPFLGQITMFGGNFNPRGWAFCNGQLLPIAQNTALFSLLGTIYGGDGRTTFGLPDMRGRSPVHWGQGPGLSNIPIGSKSGAETTTLSINNMPSHNHLINATNDAGTQATPGGNFLAMKARNNQYKPDAPNTTMNANMVANTGLGQSFTNRSPYQAVTFIIALQGVFPSRS